jgi:polyribonucleotide nucleotidyltransferase
MERARQMIQAVTAEPVIGETYEGTVKSTTAFGAFVEIMPGTEGLVHISELKHGRTEKTEDVVKKGDRVKVKLLERDERGRLRLSMKALTARPEGETQSGTEGSGGGTAMAAVGAGGEQTEQGDGGGRSDRSSSERGDRPRRSRSGSRGGGGRSRE